MKKLLGVLACFCLASCRSYDGPTSEHFDGKVFKNPWAPQTKGFLAFMQWKLGKAPAPWPSWVDNPIPTIPVEYREGNVSVTFVNHASFLIQIGGLNVLFDPVFSERTSPFTWAGPKRVRNPGIAFDQLPKIDAVLISHNHYDHMDLATLQNLSQRDESKIFVPLGDKEWLSDEGVQNVSELDWWDSRVLSPEVKIHFAPAQHWSARGIHDRNKSLWGSFLIEHRGKFIYASGDTGYGPHFQYAADRFAPIELALLPIGAYEPRWFMSYAHMNPEDSVKAFRDLKARRAIGMHFGCFQLTDESIEAPAQDLKEQLSLGNIAADVFVVPDVGGTYRYQF